MADQTFTAGQILTAAQMTTLQSNIGLTFIKSQTIGSGVASVVVPDAFSASFEKYKIVVNGGVGSTGQAITMVLGAGASVYDYVLSYVNYATGGVTTAFGTSQTSYGFVGESNTNGNTVDLDILNPFLAKYTMFFGAYIGSVAGFCAGQLKNTVSYTAFTLSVAGTMTGGTISVYGYR